MEQFTHESFLAHITPNDAETFGYTLSGIKEFEMHDGTAWTGNIRRNKKIVGKVECDGDGGCYSYHFNDVQEREAFNKAVTDAYYMRDMIDVESDCFVNYLDAKAAEAVA